MCFGFRKRVWGCVERRDEREEKRIKGWGWSLAVEGERGKGQKPRVMIVQ